MDWPEDGQENRASSSTCVVGTLTLLGEEKDESMNVVSGAL